MNRRHFIRTAGAAGIIISVHPAFALSEHPTELPDDPLLRLFQSLKGSPGLSVMWHWTGGLITREGITFDLEGMAASGIDTVMWFTFPAGAVVDGLQPTEPLTPAWMALFDHTVAEAKRLKLTLAPHVGVTWTPAGGPWITPELSQQIFVWSELQVSGGTTQPIRIARPERPPIANFGGGGPLSTQPPAPEWENYYRDLAVFALPIPSDWRRTSMTEQAIVTTSWHNQPVPLLRDTQNLTPVVETDQAGWIQFSFARPFLLRAVTVTTGPGRAQRATGLPRATFNLPAHTLRIQASDDGRTYREIARLEPMWHGWQSSINTLTHSVQETTARSFRFYYDPEPQLCYDDHLPQGTYRGTPVAAGQPSPDASPRTLPFAPLQLAHLLLSSTPAVQHLPGKNGSQWGKSRRVTDQELPAYACIPLDSIVDLTGRMDGTGIVHGWEPPPGDWLLMRFGHMSQLKRNWTGYECDKFSAAAAELQFNGWVGALRSHSAVAAEVMQILETDSWECGSQNWSSGFATEFQTRRGYAPHRYLPAMAGILIESASVTENFLQDARRTMADCISENFFGTMHRLCAEHGLKLSSESVSPVMISDNLQVFKHSDMPGGEFWVRTWQNWKPLDIKDAVSAARIYGKPIVTAESFTGGGWEDHPYALKALGDHNYAQGINQTILHCWAEQYYPNRKPGIAGPGTPFHALNTWWQPGQSWRDYMKRCEALLQTGIPVADFLYFIGEDVPNRSLLPARDGICFRMHPELPEGYVYDSINRDGLLHHASVTDGTIELGIGIRYRVLILPPDTTMSLAVAKKIREFVLGGVIVLGPIPFISNTLEDDTVADQTRASLVQQIWRQDGSRHGVRPYTALQECLNEGRMQPDVLFQSLRDRSSGQVMRTDAAETRAVNPTLTGDDRKGWGMEFQHRRDAERDIYFISNQEPMGVMTDVSFHISGKVPYLWHPETGEVQEIVLYREQEGRTILPLRFHPAESFFILFDAGRTGRQVVTAVSGEEELAIRRSDKSLVGWTFSTGSWNLSFDTGHSQKVSVTVPPPLPIAKPWKISFPIQNSGATTKNKTVFLEAGSWALSDDEDIRYFSGNALYELKFVLPPELRQADLQVWIDLGDVANLAHVRLNGQDRGVVWKPPYMLDVTNALVSGENEIAVAITNTWINRLIGDARQPATASSHSSGKTMFGLPLSASSPLLPGGLLGPVFLRFRRRITIN